MNEEEIKLILRFEDALIMAARDKQFRKDLLSSPKSTLKSIGLSSEEEIHFFDSKLEKEESEIEGAHLIVLPTKDEVDEIFKDNAIHTEDISDKSLEGVSGGGAEAKITKPFDDLIEFGWRIAAKQGWTTGIGVIA